MKITNVQYNEPKDRASALNLASYMMEQIANSNRKRANIVKNKSDTELKLKKLEEVLETYNNQINTLSGVEENWSKVLNELQEKFSLTQAEILETKSELLRKRIATLRQQAEVQALEEDLS